MNKEDLKKYSLWTAGFAATSSLAVCGYYYWLKTKKLSKSK